MDICERCKRAIGSGDTPYVFFDRPVCRACYNHLRRSQGINRWIPATLILSMISVGLTVTLLWSLRRPLGQSEPIGAYDPPAVPTEALPPKIEQAAPPQVPVVAANNTVQNGVDPPASQAAKAQPVAIAPIPDIDAFNAFAKKLCEKTEASSQSSWNALNSKDGDGAKSEVFDSVLSTDLIATQSVAYPVQGVLALDETIYFSVTVNQKTEHVYTLTFGYGGGKWKLIKATDKIEQDFAAIPGYTTDKTGQESEMSINWDKDAIEAAQQ